MSITTRPWWCWCPRDPVHKLGLLDAEAVGDVLLPAAPPAQPGRRSGTGTYPMVGCWPVTAGFWGRYAFSGVDAYEAGAGASEKAFRSPQGASLIGLPLMHDVVVERTIYHQQAHKTAF